MRGELVGELRMHQSAGKHDTRARKASFECTHASVLARIPRYLSTRVYISVCVRAHLVRRPVTVLSVEPLKGGRVERPWLAPPAWLGR